MGLSTPPLQMYGFYFWIITRTTWKGVLDARYGETMPVTWSPPGRLIPVQVRSMFHFLNHKKRIQFPLKGNYYNCKNVYHLSSNSISC